MATVRRSIRTCILQEFAIFFLLRKLAINKDFSDSRDIARTRNKNYETSQLFLFEVCSSPRTHATSLFRRHLTGEACLAWYIVRTSTVAKNRHLNIVLQAELYLRTGTYDRPKLGKTTIAKNRRLQSNSTFSFTHHLTGEALPACRAIAPFHSNTT